MLFRSALLGRIHERILAHQAIGQVQVEMRAGREGRQRARRDAAARLRDKLRERTFMEQTFATARPVLVFTPAGTTATQ